MKFCIYLILFAFGSFGVVAAPIVLEESIVSEKEKIKSNKLRDSVKPSGTFVDAITSPAPQTYSSYNRSGDYVLWANMPKIDKYRSTWHASCKDGGSAFVNVDHTSPDVYGYGGVGFVGSTGGSVTSGLDAALRIACQGK